MSVELVSADLTSFLYDERLTVYTRRSMGAWCHERNANSISGGDDIDGSKSDLLAFTEDIAHTPN